MKKILLTALFAIATLAAVADSDEWNASTLRPGDVLDIRVFRVNEFSKHVRVEEDGCFKYPQCGEIKAAGLTPREVAKSLEVALAKQITDPQVDVFVSEWAPRTVYILGEVNSSMSIALPTYGRMTALQAISAAGGFKASADLNNVAVLRKDEANSGRLQRIKIDVSALVSKSDGGDSFRLRPEDTLIVPKAPPVYVSGEVKKPSILFIDTQRPPMCSEVIILAGGMNIGADVKNVTVIRNDENGERVLLEASLATLQHGGYENDIQIQAGDYVMVSSAAEIYVLGEVKKPGPLTLAPNKTVTASQAIALAGGFTGVAKQNDITLIRNHTMTTINLKKLYNDVDNLERDLELQPGDIVFVKESMW